VVPRRLGRMLNQGSHLQNFRAVVAARRVGDMVGGQVDSACLMLRAAATFWRVWTRASVLPAVAF
jgi:hypothetical protein